MKGNVALVYRGTCYQTVKAANVIKAGVFTNLPLMPGLHAVLRTLRWTRWHCDRLVCTRAAQQSSALANKHDVQTWLVTLLACRRPGHDRI